MDACEALAGHLGPLLSVPVTPGGPVGGDLEVVVTRIGGTESIPGVDDAAIQFDVWGQSLTAVRTLAQQLTDELHNVRRSQVGDRLLVSAAPGAAVDAPDPEAGLPRVVVTAEVTSTRTP